MHSKSLLASTVRHMIQHGKRTKCGCNRPTLIAALFGKSRDHSHPFTDHLGRLRSLALVVRCCYAPLRVGGKREFNKDCLSGLIWLILAARSWSQVSLIMGIIDAISGPHFDHVAVGCQRYENLIKRSVLVVARVDLETCAIIGWSSA